MYSVYAHLHNNSIVYVGMGLNNRLRSYKGTEPTYSKSWKTFFKNKTPRLKILLQGLTFDEACLQEHLAILQYSPLLNVKFGGVFGRYIRTFPKSAEVRQKISTTQTGKSRKTIGSAHGMFGKKHTHHSLAQNSANNGTLPFMAVNLLSGVVSGPYFYRQQASSDLNIPCSSNIGSVLSGKIKSYKNFYFFTDIGAK